MLCNHRIIPHFFEFIEFPVFREHYVYDNIHIIDQYPLQCLVSFVVIGSFLTNLPHLIFYMLSNGPHLGLVTGFTNNEEIRHRLINLSHIQGNDLFSFFLLNGRNDGFDDF